MTDPQYSAFFDLLTSIKSLVESAPTLSTGIVLIMFGLGWSSAG